jgi:DNA-binding response OmpR family regulator
MEAARELEVLRAGPLEVRPGDSLALADGRPLTLSRREFDVLVVLARHMGRILGREQLFELAWGDPMRPGDRSVDVYVHKLRAKLEAALPEWSFIHTHVGFGYRLFAELSHGFHTRADGPPHTHDKETRIR